MAPKKDTPIAATKEHDHVELAATGLTPTDQTTDATGRKTDTGSAGAAQPLGQFLGFLAGHVRTLDVVLVGVGTVAAMASGCVPPLMALIFGSLSGSLQGYVADEIPESLFRQHLIQVVIYVVSLAMGEFVATYCSTAGFLIAGERITTRIREAYVDAMLHEDIGYFDQTGTGAVITRMTASMNNLQDGISQNVALLLVTASTTVAGLCVAFVRSWLLTLILLLSFLVIAAITTVGSQLSARWNATAEYHAADAAAVVEETLSSIQTVVAYSMQARQTDQYRDRLAEARKWGVRARMALGLMVAGIMFSASMSYALAFWEGARLMSSHGLTVAQVTTVVTAIMIAALSAGNVAPFLEALAKAVAAAGPVAAAIDARRHAMTARQSQTDTPLVVSDATIEFLEVSHTYPMRPDVAVLDNVSLSVSSGSRVAVVGPSGSGKSTLVYLLMRFYEPSRGQVRIGGVNIASVDVHSVRRQVGLVSQEPTLFNASVAENIAYGMDVRGLDAASIREKVVAAARTAHAHAFVTGLAQGYDTVVGERGGRLSGGQRQRIAIARAIVSDPRILVLDEATSALDTESEAAVQRGLEGASQGRTTVVIAHRLSTVRSADRIVVMAGGVVQEEGTHTELWNRHGLYRQLVQAQETGSTLQAGALVDELEAEGGSDADRSSDVDGAEKMEAASATSENEAPENEAPGLRAALARFGGFGRAWWTGVASSVLAGACQPVQSYLFAVVLAALSLPASQQAAINAQVAIWGWIYLAMAFVELGIFAVQGVSLSYAAEDILLAARADTLAALRRRPMAFFDSTTTGQLTALLATDPIRLAACAGATLGTLVRLVVTLVGGLVLALVVGWKLALVCTAAVPLSLACGWVRVVMVARLHAQTEATHHDSTAYASEALGAVRTVAALVMEQEVSGRYSRRVWAQVGRSCRQVLAASAWLGLAKGGVLLCAALGFGYGGVLVARREYALTQFYTVVSAVVFAVESFGTVFAFTPDLAKSQHAARSLAVIGDAPADDTSSSAATTTLDRDWAGDVTARDVSFAYASRSARGPVNALDGLDLAIQPNAHTAIVGSSGSGKSTVVRLLQRFYAPSRGVVTMGHQDLAQLRLDTYRPRVALVSQEPVLFQGSIADNIALGRPAAEDPAAEDPATRRRRVEQACRDANLADFVQSLPEGLDTSVGARGVSLSGGQRQRIALARALVRQPALLILDEATSSLDSQSETAVLAALDQAAHRQTTVSIAHRLSTVRHANRIYVLEHGRVVEHGTHQELVDRAGRYWDLLQRTAE